FALAGGAMPQANFLTPAAINSRLSAWISSIIASVTLDGAKSSGRELQTRYWGIAFLLNFLGSGDLFPMTRFPFRPEPSRIVRSPYSRREDGKSTTAAIFISAGEYGLAGIGVRVAAG